MAKALTDIRSYARSYSRTAIRTLKSIAAEKSAPAAARVAAAVALLDRGWGKPQQNHDLTATDQIRVTIRHMVEGMPDEERMIDVTPAAGEPETG